jgi:hypothetical protein
MDCFPCGGNSKAGIHAKGLKNHKHCGPADRIGDLHQGFDVPVAGASAAGSGACASIMTLVISSKDPSSISAMLFCFCWLP